jgi:hypothetical protein
MALVPIWANRLGKDLMSNHSAGLVIPEAIFW